MKDGIRTASIKIAWLLLLGVSSLMVMVMVMVRPLPDLGRKHALLVSCSKRSKNTGGKKQKPPQPKKRKSKGSGQDSYYVPVPYIGASSHDQRDPPRQDLEQVGCIEQPNVWMMA
jgi:hypothetical protein